MADANTNESLARIDNIIFDKEHTDFYKTQTFSFNSSGSKNRMVKIIITAEEKGIKGEYNLADIVTEQEVLAKSNNQEVSFDEDAVITSYNLFQNYPNPFNPSTIIKYQIPQDGLVTLKIYDVLGEEVKTLVNEMKSTGRYEIEFNASDLASGTYIYQIKVNSPKGGYVSAKKMLLVK